MRFQSLRLRPRSARGTPEADFPKPASETAGGVLGKIAVLGGVPEGRFGGFAQGLPGGVLGDCRFLCSAQSNCTRTWKELKRPKSEKELKRPKSDAKVTPEVAPRSDLR